jgi:hypothetical protein
MPEVRASWLMETSDPRNAGGAISEMYIGVVRDAAPIAIPTTTRPAINVPTDGANAVPTAPTEKPTPAATITQRRPKRSASHPPIPAPSSAPTKTTLTTSSGMVEDRAKSFLMKRIAPEITPVS